MGSAIQANPGSTMGLPGGALGADALEPDECGRPDLPSIQPDVIRPDARRQRTHLEQLAIKAGNLHPQPPGLRVPVHRHEPLDALHTLGVIGN